MKISFIKKHIYEIAIFLMAIYMSIFFVFMVSEIGIINLERGTVSILGRITLICSPILLIISPIVILKTQKKIYKIIGISCLSCVALMTLAVYLVLLSGI